MTEEDTNTEAVQTQEAQVANEVKPEQQAETQDQQVQAEQATEGDVENSNQEKVPEEQAAQEPTQEELKAKLKQYEVRDEEERLIKEKLGLGDVDSQTYHYQNIDQQLVNEGKTAYLRLCNEYGVDYDLSTIDANIEKLKVTDPAKGYEFQNKLERLTNDINGKRQYVQQQTNVYEVNKFQSDYKPLLEASPAFSNIMAQYVDTYGGSTSDLYGQLQEIAQYVMPVMKECFEAGKVFALSDKAKRDTTQVSGGVATSNANAYSSGTTFTREQIKHMSPAEFAKYESIITQQMREGKIQ